MRAIEAIAGESRESKTTESILIILNVSHMFMIVMTACFFLGLLTDLGTDGTMRWVVAAGVVLFSDLAFIGIGVALLFAAKHTEVSRSNHLAVWLTIPILSLLPIPEIYSPIIGIFPTDAQIAWLSIPVSAALFIWTYIETAKVWRAAKL